ncbi:MAG: DUF1932 domain-containing protein [Anaerolineaceae bacterium]|nr:DUF1932 domain-containing protein [Anaerolineaceae bacterium]MDE0330104.1 DUF1932 domain-containing protein [Anaerolineaceae bacterium]
MNTGILHPGEMGISIAATMKNSGHEVSWVPEGRSAATRERAVEHKLRALPDLPTICAEADALVSVCPPAAAEGVAMEALAAGFRGLYLDANAIAPQRAQRMAAAMEAEGATFVDGSIIGGPAWQPGKTWMILSGDASDDAAALLAAGPLETRILEGEVGRASALKMVFAGWTKGTSALLAAVLGTAEALGVRDELTQQWARSGMELAESGPQRTRVVTGKAWRFVGEMEEISATFAGVGLPGDFHQGAAEVYRRMADFKDASELPALEDVLASLKGDDGA